MPDYTSKQCSHCKRELPLDEHHFHRDKQRKDGFTCSCKECRGKVFTSPKPIIPDGFKVCSACKQLKPLEEFHKHSSGHKGRIGKCKECRKPEYTMTQEELLASKERKRLKWALGIFKGKKHTEEAKKRNSVAHKAANRLKTPPTDMFAFSRVYKRYKKKYSPDGVFEISEEDFRILTSSRCHYCDCLPYAIEKGRDIGYEYVYNGLDRVDNEKGYMLSNVVPCCKKCNQAKLAYSQDDFWEWALRVAETYHKRKLS